jgi:hypothetical protein
MSRKPFSLRSVVITAVAMAIGSAVGMLAEAFAARIGYAGPGVGQAATAMAALWSLDKLNALID